MTKDGTEGSPLVIGGSLVIGHSGSYRYCRAVTRAANSSFPLAFRLLPPPKRRAMDALYAFMRVSDDLADDPGADAAALAAWRAALTDALAGRYSHAVHPALHHAVERYAIPPRFLFDVLDGVAADVEPVRVGTFAELYPYCYRVASAVGLACVRVWGLRPGATWAEADAPAEAAGIAFQLTNILRDVGEDAARGRVYLPADELAAFGVDPRAWSSRAPAFVAMMRFQAARARAYYAAAEGLTRFLTADGRAIYGLMCATYRGLLDEIERRGFDVFAGRVRVPRWRKAAALLAAWPASMGW
ncbi:MAG: phytoene/squalene synthase family protein [Gemmataceae bacterium]